MGKLWLVLVFVFLFVGRASSDEKKQIQDTTQEQMPWSSVSVEEVRGGMAINVVSSQKGAFWDEDSEEYYFNERSVRNRIEPVAFTEARGIIWSLVKSNGVSKGIVFLGINYPYGNTEFLAIRVSFDFSKDFNLPPISNIRREEDVSDQKSQRWKVESFDPDRKKILSVYRR